MGAISLELMDRFGQKKILVGQNLTLSPYILSAARFGLAFFDKSVKGDFLLKIQLTDLSKSVFGHP